MRLIRRLDVVRSVAVGTDGGFWMPPSQGHLVHTVQRGAILGGVAIDARRSIQTETQIAAAVHRQRGVGVARDVSVAVHAQKALFAVNRVVIDLRVYRQIEGLP